MVTWEALDALSHQLELCNIDANTRVVVLFDAEATTGATTADRVSLIRAAVARTGAPAIDIRPIRADDAADQTLLLQAAESADVMITTSARHAHALRRDGLNTLLLEASAPPHHYPPHASLRQRVRSLADQLGRGASLRLFDDHGTALELDVTTNKTTLDHGLLDDNETNVAFPAGWVATTPGQATVSGELVLMPGDANISAGRSISSPIRCEIIDDHVATINGDSPDADVLRALFEYSGESASYGVASIAVGLNPGTSPIKPFDTRLLNPHLSRLGAGVITISFGENLLANRPCNQTVMLALPGRNVTLDGLPVVTNGSLQGDFAPDVYEL